jgi:hypothetical protein
LQRHWSARGADQGDTGDGKIKGEDDGSGVRDGETMRDAEGAAGCTDEGCGASGSGNGGIHRTTIHKSRRHGNEERAPRALRTQVVVPATLSDERRGRRAAGSDWDNKYTVKRWVMRKDCQRAMAASWAERGSGGARRLIGAGKQGVHRWQSREAETRSIEQNSVAVCSEATRVRWAIENAGCTYGGYQRRCWGCAIARASGRWRWEWP